MTKLDRKELESRIHETHARLERAEAEHYAGPGGTKELREAAAQKKNELDRFTKGCEATQAIATQLEGQDYLGERRLELVRQIREAIRATDPDGVRLAAEYETSRATCERVEAAGRQLYQARVRTLHIAKGETGPFHIDAQLRNDLLSWQCIKDVLAWAAKEPEREQAIDAEALRDYREVIREPVATFVVKIDRLLEGTATMGEVIPSPVFAHHENRGLAGLKLPQFFAAIADLIDSASAKNPITEHIEKRNQEEIKQSFIALSDLAAAGEKERPALMDRLERTAQDVEFGWGPNLDFSRLLRLITVTHQEIRPSLRAELTRRGPA